MAKQNSGPATDTASIQQRIAEPLRKAIEPLMVQPATVFDEQVESLKKLLNKADELPKGTVQSTRESLSALEEARDRANAGYLEGVRESIAKAVLGALRDVDVLIPLQLKQPAPVAVAAPAVSSGGGGRKRRASSQAIEQAAEQVAKALPPAGTPDQDCKGKAAIADETGLDRQVVGSALTRLAKEGRAESNGVRGPAGGWRLK